MNTTITFQADETLEQSVERECRLSGETRDEFMKDAIERQVLLNAFERARELLVPIGKTLGYHTDEDVFRDMA